MPHPTIGPDLDVPAIRATIHATLNERPAPPPERLRQLDVLLRAHIGLLLPSAVAAVDELWRGSLGWYERRARVHEIRTRLAQRPGSGLPAVIHVRHLAHDCAALLNYPEADQ